LLHPARRPVRFGELHRFQIHCAKCCNTQLVAAAHLGREIVETDFGGSRAFGSLPGEFTIRAYLKNTLLTARDGGHHSIDALVTSATSIGPNERFRLEGFQPDFTLIRTAGNFFVSARGAGGIGGNGSDDSQTFQTERTALADDALFRVEGPSAAGTFTIRTFNGHFVTALGGGGKSTRAFHTDATKALSWEFFYILKTGDLGSGFQYAIRPSGTGNIPGRGDVVSYLTARDGGGRTREAMTAFSGLQAFSKFRLIRQPNGSFALKTANGINFVTAEGGGGLAHGTPQADNLQTNRTVAQAWEQFRIVDTGGGVYTIQTDSGFFLAVGPGFSTFSTRISDPDAAPSIGYNAKFEFVMLGL
jgi:hypothetical protein